MKVISNTAHATIIRLLSEWQYSGDTDRERNNARLARKMVKTLEKAKTI